MIKSSLLAISLTVVFATIYYVNGENWLVQVGGAVGKNVYAPASFDANVGDTVTFQFVDGTHDVIQADEIATCAKSKIADSFFTPKFPGNAATPPQAVWGPLPKVGKLFYFCDIADHCEVGKMFGSVNVLAAGEPLVEAGVKGPAAPVEPAAAPAPSTPVQPPAPADDKPNQPYVPPATPSATPPKSPASAPPTPLSGSSANTYKQISITVMGSTLLSSLAGYFLFL